MKTRKRARKPDCFPGACGGFYCQSASEDNGAMVFADQFMIGQPDDCRALARWLERAAIYLEQEEEK